MKKTLVICITLVLLCFQSVHFQLVAQAEEAEIVQQTKAKLKQLKSQKDELVGKLKTLQADGDQIGEEVKAELKELMELVQDRTQLSDDVNERIDAIANGESKAHQLEALNGVDKLGKEGILVIGAAAKKSTHREVRQKALTAAVGIGREALPAVVFSFEDLGSEDRTHLVELLGESKLELKLNLFHLVARKADEALLKVMLRYLDKADDKLMFLAALAREDDPDHNGILIDQVVKLQDKDALLMLYIAASSSEKLAPKAVKLATKYKTQAFPVLAGGFDSDSVELRKAIVLAAKEIGGQGGELLIQHALEDENEELRQAAQDALK